jgi:uncharacterized protein
MTHSVLLCLGAAVAALFVVGVLGLGAAMRGLGGRRSQGSRGGPVVFGDGGWSGKAGWPSGGGGGGFGGFSSGGGGDFGGGGAGGNW